MNYQYIERHRIAARIASITLNRPEAANALNTALARELREALQRVAQDQDVRALIVTGAGDRAFCAGADLKERRGMDRQAWDAQHHAFEEALNALAALDIPTIAAVNGAAVAGGLELALACDLIVAHPRATFAFKEATLGIMPGLGGTQRLPRAIGARAAFEMLLLSDTIDAATALRLGLINRISGDDLLKEAHIMAEKIASSAPLSIRAIKKAVYQGSAMPLDAALKLELQLYGTLIETEDRIEGINAFNEKRKPQFNGN